MKTTYVFHSSFPGQDYINEKKRGQTMEFLITVAVVIMAITSLSMEGKVRELTKQNKEIIELLKQDKENKFNGQL